MGDLPVTVADIEAAAAAIADAVPATPTACSRTLSQVTGAEIWVKFENLQFTASFKERGALTKLLSLDAGERARGVVTASAGNHAQAVAYHAGRLGIPATIVMPSSTPHVKVARTEHLGATVTLHGVDYETSAAHAAQLADGGLVSVPAFDDRAVIAGQGTLALEMLAAVPDLDVLVVPVGGGGLISGCAIAAKARRPDLEVVGVHIDMRETGATIADGIAVKRPGELTSVVIDELVDELVPVHESWLEQAIGLYLEVEKTVAEGAGAATLAALLEHPDRFRRRRVGLVLSGGNIDLRVLATVIVRTLARSGRLVRLRAEVDDVPGALGGLTTMIGAEGGNIVELAHRRDLPGLGLRRAEVVLTIETRDEAHVDALLEHLRAAGVRADVETDV
jgi:threonine dehydratase